MPLRIYGSLATKSAFSQILFLDISLTPLRTFLHERKSTLLSRVKEICWDTGFLPCHFATGVAAILANEGGRDDAVKALA